MSHRSPSIAPHAMMEATCDAIPGEMQNSPSCHHAMPLPRLGCGGPSHGSTNINPDHGNDESNMFVPMSPHLPPSQDAEDHRPCKRRCPDALQAPLNLQPPFGDLTRAMQHSQNNQDTTPCMTENDKGPPDSDDHSPITVPSESPTISDTVPFQPVLKGIIKWKHYQESFWFAADIPAAHLERIWELGQCCTFHDFREAIAACLTPLDTSQREDEPSIISRTCLMVLMDGEFTVLRVEPNEPLLQQSQVTSLAGTLYDQFGALNEGQTTDFGTVLLIEPMTHGVNSKEIVFVLAAFAQTTMTWHVCKTSNTVRATFAGEHTAANFLRRFFMQALTAHSLQHIGRKAYINDSDELLFEPMRLAGVMPSNPFLIALAVAAVRTLLDCLETDQDHPTGQLITIKWAGRPLWKGHLPETTTLATLECILRYCFAPWGLTSAFRLVYQGVQLPLESTIEQLPIDERRKDKLLHAIMALRGGGNGTKMQQRAVQQNALASTLLDHGFNLAWTTKAVESIMEKFGLGKLQTVNSQPMGNAKIQAILTLCKEAGVVVPDVTKPRSGNEIPGTASAKRKKKALDFKLNPADYTLMDGFFTREDGSQMPQVSQIVPQSCEICIQSAAQAEVWVREGQKISANELGLLVLGPIAVHTNLVSEEVTFPSYNCDKQMVLITATLVQLGAKTINHKQGDPKQVPSESCSLVAVTMYKEDWPEDEWRAITTNPTAAVRKQLDAEGLSMGIQAIWGKSLRHQRAPATPIQATTVQVHMTVEDSTLERLLSRSGFNRLFLTPKTQVGRLNSDYKVIWIPGDVPKLTSLSTKCQACLGLVRGRQGKGYGLRFHMDKYDAAWAVLMPGMTPPQNNPGDKVYKLQNLPFGCTKLMLQNWAEAMKWNACPIRALGPQTWIVRSTDEIPPGIPMFNSSPILARLLPPREQHGHDKILLGPRPKPPTTVQMDPWHQGQASSLQDPWANYGNARAPPSAPALPMPPQQGPTEKRLVEQDAKIASIQAGLDQLVQTQKHHAKQVESQFKQAAQREQDNMNKMDQALKHIEVSVDNAMTKSMHQYQASMDEKFQEIKHLFLSTKRPAPPGEEDMQD